LISGFHFSCQNGVCSENHKNKKQELTSCSMQSLCSIKDLKDLVQQEQTFEYGVYKKYDIVRVDVELFMEAITPIQWSKSRLQNPATCFSAAYDEKLSAYDYIKQSNLLANDLMFVVGRKNIQTLKTSRILLAGKMREYQKLKF
jgi:Tfp pilus tip-associated adhesin PilY1